jgi:3-oxoacyl-[acyl-carrier-protein] synthase I
MRSDIWVMADNVVSPLGLTSEENYRNVVNGHTGVTPFSIHDATVFTARFKSEISSSTKSRFDALCINVIEGLSLLSELDRNKTIFILSTTKGNIDLLNEESHDWSSIHLHTSAKNVASYFGFKHYLVVSNACISGVMALLVGKRLLQNGQYDHAVIVGADVLSEFVVRGFQSLMALSDGPCKPFDADRNGINLGEGAGAILLSTKPDGFAVKPSIKITGGGMSNDANHISGPSRTGEELAHAIKLALAQAQRNTTNIGFVSAHGTATVYNDEMEAKAFALVGLENVPLHSLKGNFGHTLGAAGIIETIMSIHSLQKDEILPTKGFLKHGVSKKVNISEHLLKKESTSFLKTASGFGGCNAAIVMEKSN